MANAAVLRTPSLRRRNSITTPLVLPTYSSSTSTTTSRATSISSSSASTQSLPAADFEQLIKPSSYTSIRDLLPSPAAVQSPTASSSAQSGGYEISIRNRLVKQAAWAYLQPISIEPESSGRSFIHRLVDLVSAPVLALFRLLTRSFEWMLRSVRVKSAW